ncbi:MAG: hypothetical protein AM1032_000129 [Mycoplasmataceae bacterium]|nr:MAG: hypothetical protein AM1032_000129 [Mycoplasmataceae bacterium]
MDKKNDNYWFKFGTKLVITATLGIVLGPLPSVIAGISTLVTAKTIENVVEDQDIKDVFNFASECGQDLLIGGALGGVGGLIFSGGSSSASSTANQMAKESVKYQAKKQAGKEVGKWTAEQIANGVSKEIVIKIAKEKAAKKTAEIISNQVTKEVISKTSSEIAAQRLSSVGKNIYDAAKKISDDKKMKIHLEHLENNIKRLDDCEICRKEK